MTTPVTNMAPDDILNAAMTEAWLCSDVSFPLMQPISLHATFIHHPQLGTIPAWHISPYLLPTPDYSQVIARLPQVDSYRTLELAIREKVCNLPHNRPAFWNADNILLTNILKAFNHKHTPVQAGLTDPVTFTATADGMDYLKKLAEVELPAPIITLTVPTPLEILAAVQAIHQQYPSVHFVTFTSDSTILHKQDGTLIIPPIVHHKKITALPDPAALKLIKARATLANGGRFPVIYEIQK